MGLITKSGVISHLSEGVVTFGNDRKVVSQHSSVFRINDFPAKLKSGNHNSLSNGDNIKAVGEIKKGTLVIYAYKNETTGAYDEAQVTIPIVLGICLLVLGIPLSLIIIGLPLVFFGGMMLYSAYLANEAKKMLHQI
jgi:hypothetical protein